MGICRIGPIVFAATRYPLTRTEWTAPPIDAADFNGRFRIGHDPSADKLYVAVEVEDESIVVDSTSSVCGTCQHE
jgi:hypothetical protein